MKTKAPLVNQKTWWPTRKTWAVILTGAILGGVRAALDAVWPGNPFEPVLQELGAWLQGAIFVAVMYMTRDRQN